MRVSHSTATISIFKEFGLKPTILLCILRYGLPALYCKESRMLSVGDCTNERERVPESQRDLHLEVLYVEAQVDG